MALDRFITDGLAGVSFEPPGGPDPAALRAALPEIAISYAEACERDDAGAPTEAAAATLDLIARAAEDDDALAEVAAALEGEGDE